MEYAIEITRLRKRFGSKVAVQSLSLTVPRGAIFALLGDNGAGKTTTIRVLTGQVRADEGRAFLLGHDCWSAAVALRQRVGYVPERPRFYDWMTVAEIGWFTGGFHERGYGGRYRDLVAQFHLDPQARLQHLSKGQYSKVALSLALASDPEVLILDEPTSGLDLLVRREFLSSMVEMAGAGRTILISSHQIAEVERIASHVAFMSQGQLLLTATLDDLRQRVVRYRLRHDGPSPDADDLGQVLQRNGHGRLWEAVVKDPVAGAVARLRHADGIHDFEESPLPLEEVYCALLSRKEVPA